MTKAAFSEDDIRPDALMGEQDRLHAQDLARLRTRRAEFVEVDCPACGSADRRHLWEKDGFRYVACISCDTAFVSPRPTPDILEEYYESAENYRYWAQHVFPASEATRREQIVRPRLKRVLEICERQGLHHARVLEVGAGFGSFCEEAVASGAFAQVTAVEPTPSLAAACRARGLEVIDRPIEQVSLGENLVDVVVSFEVIEHLFSPGDFLRGCARLLRPGGLAVLTCPNWKGFDILVLGPGSPAVDVEHLNYFHPESLAHLLETCGFRLLEAFTPGQLDADIVRKRSLAGLYDLGQHSFLRRVLVEEWDRLGGPFQGFLASHGLSSHLWVVASRNTQ